MAEVIDYVKFAYIAGFSLLAFWVVIWLLLGVFLSIFFDYCGEYGLKRERVVMSFFNKASKFEEHL